MSLEESSVVCASFNQEGTFLALGFRHGFGVFACEPFAERYRRTFHRSERIRVAPHFFAPAAVAASAALRCAGTANDSASIRRPFAFQAVQMLHDTNLIALVGNGEPIGDVAPDLHYTQVFQRHKLIIWDICTDSVFLDIDLQGYVTSPVCRGITGVKLFRDGYRAVGSRRAQPGNELVDPCDWPDDDTQQGERAARDNDRRQPACESAALFSEASASPTRRGDAGLHRTAMTFFRFLDAAAAVPSSIPSFDSMREVASRAFQAQEPDAADSVFKIRVQLATERTGTFTYCIEGATIGEECQYRVFQVSHHAATQNSRGIAALRSVSFAPSPARAAGRAVVDAVCSDGLFMALPATSLGCLRVVYATAQALGPEPASAFIEAHAAQKNELGCLAVATTCEIPASRPDKPRRSFIVASASVAAHSVHLYRVTVALDTSAPPAVLECTKLKELRRAYANNAALSSVGVVEHDTVACMAFSPSNTHLAVASTLGVVLVYAVAAAREGAASPDASATHPPADDVGLPQLGADAQAAGARSSALSEWGSWLGSAIVSGAKSLVAATMKAVDHESPVLSIEHPALRAPEGNDVGQVVDLAFSLEAATPVLHIVTAAGNFASFALDLTAATPTASLLHELHHIE